MRKSSPRIVAGILLLAVFASVGLMTARAFSVNAVEPTTLSASAKEKADSNWNEAARKVCDYKP